MMQFGDEVILFDNTDDGNGNYVDDTRLTTEEEEEEEEVTPTGGRSSNVMSTSSTALRERGHCDEYELNVVLKEIMNISIKTMTDHEHVDNW